MVDKYDPDTLVEEKESEQDTFIELAQEVVEWFIDNRGDMIPREQASNKLSDEFDVNKQTADKAITEVVGDIVDPVQQITKSDGKFVGIIKYDEFHNAGAYGYMHYDAVSGKAKRMVCARCVETEETDKNVAHATEGRGSVPEDANWDDLKEHLIAHYRDSHDVDPTEIVPGATLLSGTTISGNHSIHTGNESDLSFYDGSKLTADADSVDGFQASDLAKQNVGVQNPVYATTGDVPSDITEGETVYISGEGTLYVEDGT